VYVQLIGSSQSQRLKQKSFLFGVILSRSFSTLVIALLAISVYWVSLPFDFVLDDIVHIVQNNTILDPNTDLQAILSESVMPGNIYRPGLILSYKWTYDLFGLNPVPFHITNLILHAVNCILIYLLCFRIPAISKYAWVGSLLFAVHPIHVEAVANISGRSELLCHFWGLLATNLFLEASNKTNTQPYLKLFFAGLCIFFSLLIKESGATYFLAIPLILFFCGNSLKDSITKCAIPLTLAMIAYLPLRYNALGGFFAPGYTTEAIDNPLVNANFLERIYTALYVLGFGFVKTFLPTELSADYSLNELTTLSPFHSITESIVVLLVLAGLIFTVFAFSKRDFLGFIGSWIFSTTAVTSNIFFISGTIFGERHLYLSSLGICLAFAKLCLSINSQIIKRSLCALLIINFSAKSIKESFYWESLKTFFTAQLFKAPNSAKTSYNYGLYLLQNSHTQEAIPYLQKTLQIYPNYQQAHVWLGRIAKNAKNKEAALEQFQSALNISPQDPEIILEIARLLHEENKIDEANKYFSLLAQRYPNNLYTAIGEYLMLKNRGAKEKAADLLSKMLEASPNNYILNELKYGNTLRD
jgi:tetratricopeptide (TPR) repeat protein